MEQRNKPPLRKTHRCKESNPTEGLCQEDAELFGVSTPRSKAPNNGRINLQHQPVCIFISQLGPPSNDLVRLRAHLTAEVCVHVSCDWRELVCVCVWYVHPLIHK